MLTHLHIVNDYFHAIMAERSCCHKEHMTYKSYNIYYLALYRKSPMTPIEQLPVQILQHVFKGLKDVSRANSPRLFSQHPFVHPVLQ